MQQISKVKGTAAHNQKASQSCSCWKGDTVCYSLCKRSGSWGNPHGSCIAGLCSSLPTVTWKKSAGVLQERDRNDVWLNQLFLSRGEDVFPLHAQFSSVWEAFDLLKYSTQLLKCEISCMMVPSVCVATQCVRPHWSAPVKSLDTIFLLQVSEHAAGGCLWQTPHLGWVFCPKNLGLCFSSQPLLMSVPISHVVCCSPSCQ